MRMRKSRHCSLSMDFVWYHIHVRFSVRVLRACLRTASGRSNKAVPRMAASRFAQRQDERHRRLAPVADLVSRGSTRLAWAMRPQSRSGHRTPGEKPINCGCPAPALGLAYHDVDNLTDLS